MHTVEFQKRGLPHVHIIIWLADCDKPKTPLLVDKIISAELPNPLLDPVGYEAVTKFMLHGPCGDARPSCPCMKDGKCSKFFPKPFVSETTFDDNGYVTYRRRLTDVSAIKSGAILDNGYVVPYNRDLLVKYQAHLNYLFKYITKGPDRSEVTTENSNLDEISQYLDCRSISSYEAIWRLFSFQIHERTPSVFILIVHLPGQQQLTFQEGQPLGAIVNRPDITKTMLTEWFTLNRTCPSARKYTYADITHAFKWNPDFSQWTVRKKGFAIGRVASVPPKCGDGLYLRMLLTKIPGALSYEDLRTVNNILYDDFQKVCQALGLLSTDDEWSSLEHFNLPLPRTFFADIPQDDLISQQLQYDTTREHLAYNSTLASLNHYQKIAHDAIVTSLEENTGKFFFLYGHGGTGKTYLYSCIVSCVRSLGQIARVVASSGIAATLLPGGVTAHSRFKIPIEVEHGSTCSIKKGTALARLMQQASLIVWDEAPMVHRLSFEAVDRTLCDVMNIPTEGPNYKPFGGKTVILGGDFRQTLPVITDGSRGDKLAACLTRSYLWNHCILLELHANMRINDSEVNRNQHFHGMNFSDWVLALGDGKLGNIQSSTSTHNDRIQLPQQFVLPASPNPIAALVDLAYIRNRAIVTPTNNIVTEINDYVLSQLPGDMKIYLSSDTLTTPSPDQQCLEEQYPTEFLNGLSFNVMPEHQLRFKPYTMVMLLRNLNPATGLCNGTRILITHLGANVIRGLIIGGIFEGTIAIIPRIVLDYTDPNWPFTLRRRQYPLRLCYAMTINKSQGQTLEQIGIYLPTPVFSHG
ncbi:ATP-dependent DNA helicase PIF1 [Linum grandiflorum]